jgi:predicted lipoprotein
MLTAYVDEILIPNYETVASMATEMTAPEGALANYCGAIGSGEEADAQSAVRQAWGELATSIQKAELHAIGPAAANSSSLQFRLNSYMFGSLSTCGVDGIAAKVDDNVDINSRSINQRGVGALEYLLLTRTSITLVPRRRARQ